MPHSLSDVYITVHLDIDINGEPITRIINAQAEMEVPENTEGKIHLHLHLDGMELARILYPAICEIATKQM
jgi:hypothetical protein